MKCDNCKRIMNYCFYINDEYWRKIIRKEKFKKNQGYLCAHCILEKLGGNEWYIIWNEPTEKSPKKDN